MLGIDCEAHFTGHYIHGNGHLTYFTPFPELLCCDDYKSICSSCRGRGGADNCSTPQNKKFAYRKYRPQSSHKIHTVDVFCFSINLTITVFIFEHLSPITDDCGLKTGHRICLLLFCSFTNILFTRKRFSSFSKTPQYFTAFLKVN